MSISNSYFAARRPIVEGPGEINSGAWPITWFRIAKGWGLLPYDFWPDQGKVSGTVMPNEPPNADAIAKRDRLVHYQRLRSEEECLYAVVNDRMVATSLEISRAWRDPPSGRIQLDGDGLPVVAVHSISPLAFNFDTHCFVFRNTWGDKWGDKGVGYLPFGYLARFMIEAWTSPVRHPETQPSRPGVYLGIRQGEESKLGVPWVVDIQDGDNDVIVGWAHTVQRETFFDVEEIFVRPDYRRKGYGSALVREIRKAVPSSLPIRFWIPWGDHCEPNAPCLLGWARKLGLRLEPAGVRWAAYRAADGMPVESLPELAWTPPKATSPIELLCDPEERVEDKDVSWDDGKATRRAELVEKKYRSSLTTDEQAELALLQDEFGRYQDIIAPLPTE